MKNAHGVHIYKQICLQSDEINHNVGTRNLKLQKSYTINVIIQILKCVPAFTSSNKSSDTMVFGALSSGTTTFFMGSGQVHQDSRSLKTGGALVLMELCCFLIRI